MPAPAAYRYTMIFQYVSGAAIGGYLNLKGGWSESLYWNQTGPNTLSAFQQLAQARAQLLPASAYVSGIRVQGVDPSGGAQTFSVNYGGGGTITTNEQDIPQMALLLRARSSGISNVRSMRLAAIPDAQISYGEYSPSSAYGISMAFFLAALNGWRFRSQDLNQTLYRIQSIDAAGNIVLIDPYVVAPGTNVKIKRTIDPFGNAKGMKTTVTTYTDPLHIKVTPWLFGASTGGLLQPYVIIYPAIAVDSNTVSRVVVRKIGRPSLGYRGRRSKRKL